MLNGSKSRWKRFAGIIALAALVTFVSACSSAKEAPKAAASQEQVKAVKVANITKMQIADPDEVVADVVPSKQIDVVLKADGDVEKIVKKRGETVKEGDVIIALDRDDALRNREKAALAVQNANAQLDKGSKDLQNNIAKLETQLKDTEKQYNKMRNDYDLGLVGKFQLEQMEDTVNNLRRDLQTLKNTDPIAPLQVQQKTAQLTLQDAEKMLDYHEVKAPISGLITELPVEEGMTLPRGLKAAQIQQLNPIKIKADLTESAYPSVNGKTELEMYVPGGKEKWKGKISFLSSVVNSQTKAYALELEVANPDLKLKPGMRVQVLLNSVQDQEVVAVPTLSIVRENGENFVFVLVGDTVEKRKVELGRLKELVQEVLSGVKEGEQLVVSGQHQLKDKEKVQLAKSQNGGETK